MAIRTGLNNHVELVHRPGEAHLVGKLLSLLGYELERSGTVFAGVSWQFSPDQIVWVSEVTAEQWAFEQWLERQLRESDAPEGRKFAAGLRAQPQKFAHFGVGMPTLGDWEAAVARVSHAASDDPELKGRVSLPLVARPGDKGSVAYELGGDAGRTIYQAFLQTDIISSGLLTLGQAIEIQHYRENDPAWVREG